MATIILEPQEHFEHLHEVESRTVLLEGALLLTRAEETIQLEQGVTVVTPPGVNERFDNPGPGRAVFGCLHGPADTTSGD